MVILITIASGVIWLISGGERSLQFLTPTIEEGLNEWISQQLPGYRLNIHDTRIAWDEWQQSIDIRVQQVHLHDPVNTQITTLPELSLGFRLHQLIRGFFEPERVVLIKPQFALNLPAITTTKGDIGQKLLRALQPLYRLMGSDGASINIENIALRDAAININHQGQEHQLMIHEAYGSFTTDKDKIELNGETIFSLFDDQQITLELSAMIDANQTAVAQLTVLRLPSKDIVSLLPNTLQEQHNWLSTSDVVADIEILASLSAEGELQVPAFAISQFEGDLQMPKLFPGNIAVRELNAKGNISQNLRHFHIESLAAKTNGSVFKFKGKAQLAASPEDPLYRLAGEASLANVPADHVDHFWPLPLAPRTREWVVSRLSEGNVNTASLIFDIKEPYVRQKHFPKESIQAQLEVEAASLNNIPYIKPVSAVNGSIEITGQDLTIALSTGKMLSSQLKQATLHIPSFKRDIIKELSIKGEVHGPVIDLFQLYPDPNLTQKIFDMNGLAKSEFDILIPLKANVPKEEIELQVKSQLINVEKKALIEGVDLAEGNFAFSLNNRQFEIAGSGLINTIPSKLLMRREFSNPALKGYYEWQAVLTDAEREKIGFPKIPYLHDTIDMYLAISDVGDYIQVDTTLNLTDATVVVPTIKWEKLYGIPAALEATLVLEPDKPLTISEFHFKSDKNTVDGSALIDVTDNSLLQLQIERMQTPANDFALQYTALNKGHKLMVRGARLDISTLNFKDWMQQDRNAPPQVIQLAGNISQLTLKQGQIWYNSILKLQCGIRQCQEANFYALTDKGHTVAASLSSIDNKQQFLLESGDAGAVVKGLGISKHIVDGKLTLNATKESGKQELVGDIRLKDFHVVKTPLLTKLLTLSSLPGILDRLNQQGISFREGKIPFRYNKGIASIKDANGFGNTLGITADGHLNFNKGELKLGGVVVPSTILPTQELNKILSNIPIVGDVLIGGEGEGIFAANYSIKGKIDDPKVTVNPASMLTPGLLRKIFSVFSIQPESDISILDEDPDQPGKMRVKIQDTSGIVTAPIGQVKEDKLQELQ